MDGGEAKWEEISTTMNQIVANVLGVTSGCPPKAGKETWWWTEKVQQAVKEKKDRK